MTPNTLILGAGPAGCVLANRLSADPHHRVLLLEAGGPDNNPAYRIPAAYPSFYKGPADWAYETTPQTGFGGRRDYMPRGKVIGGSSTINAMIFQRGHRSDYDAWAAQGNAGWGFDDLLPLFKRAQHQTRGESDWHGVGGPLHTTDLRDPHPITQAFLASCDALDLPRNNDFNADSQIGMGLYQVNQRDGLRHSAATAYLTPVLDRPNLEVRTHAHVTRLLFEGKTCVGAVYLQDGEQIEVRADRVVLCAGAINSPQLLMLSGIGPAEHLAEHGIPLVHDLPGVGQNLRDHVMVPVAVRCAQRVTLRAATSPPQQALFRDKRMGMMTSNLAEAGGFLRLNASAPAPELQFHFAPGYFIFHTLHHPGDHGYSLCPTLATPKSVGQLRLASADPLAAPEIDPNYLSHPDDLPVLLHGVKLARQILAQGPFMAFHKEEYLPGTDRTSDAELTAFIREWAAGIYHPVGTCKMGDVVDDQLAVRGIQGLFVADASVMPTLPNANTHFPVVVIGEKAADLLSRGTA